MDIPSAKDLRTRLKKREEASLDDLDENETLIVEYHSPAGTVVRVRDIGYYLDSDDALVLGGWDARSGHQCQIMVSPLTLNLVFRVVRVKEDEVVPEKRPIGFIRGPEFGQS